MLEKENEAGKPADSGPNPKGKLHKRYCMCPLVASVQFEENFFLEDNRCPAYRCEPENAHREKACELCAYFAWER
jgi:hypothetical protein